MTTISKMLISTTLVSSTLLAQTTMCFTKNVKDITTLEDIKLNGGECKSAYSLNDMKKDGWEVNDIKINNNDYIYILKKGANISWNGTTTNTEEIEERLLKKMEERRKKELKEKKETEAKAIIDSARTYFESKCQSCHGQKGELEPGFSVAIKDLTKNQFLEAMDGYRFGSYNKGSADQMKAYASTTTEQESKNIFEYLKSLDSNISK